MFGNNREDDLLSKLKSCIGSLKTEKSTVLPPKIPISSHNYNAIKENYRNPSITPPVAGNSSNNGMNKNSLYPSPPYPERQPLTASNHPPVTYTPTYNYPQPPRQELPINPNRYEQEVRPRTKVEDYRSSENTPRKFDYGF
jgi:hypothetical protein